MVSLRTMLAPGFKSVYLPKGSIQNQVMEVIAQTQTTELSFLHVPTPPFVHAITTTANNEIPMQTKNIGLAFPQIPRQLYKVRFYAAAPSLRGRPVQIRYCRFSSA